MNKYILKVRGMHCASLVAIQQLTPSKPSVLSNFLHGRDRSASPFRPIPRRNAIPLTDL